MEDLRIAPSKNEYSKFKTGYIEFMMVAPESYLDQLERFDRIAVCEPYIILKSGEVIYRYDFKGSNAKWHDFMMENLDDIFDFGSDSDHMPDHLIRMHLVVADIMHVHYQDIDMSIAQMLHLENVFKTKRKYIKILPRILRRVYGPKFNPNIKIIQVKKTLA